MEKLFSYGTLQLEQVQLSTFGRSLQGTSDSLIGYHLDTVKITNPEVIRKSGTDTHPILRHTGHVEDEVHGTVLSITPSEFKNADTYEADDYHRIAVTLKSGMDAWLYVAKEE